MKIKQLKKILEQFSDDTEIYLSSDEELNVLYKDIDASKVEGYDKVAVMWGNSGSEAEL